MGRVRGCVCDREIVRGLYGWEIEGGVCAIERCPEREIEIDHAQVCDGD